MAVYPGSFDPPTLGHLDVIERASKLFERVIVGVGKNSAKNALLSVEERCEALASCTLHLSNVEVATFGGLLIDFVAEHGAQSIVRGLRATADFEYEFQMAMVNRRLSESIETIFLMTRWDYSYLSSSIVKEVALLGGDYSGLVPAAVVPMIDGALKRRQAD